MEEKADAAGASAEVEDAERVRIRGHDHCAADALGKIRDRRGGLWSVYCSVSCGAFERARVSLPWDQDAWTTLDLEVTKEFASEDILQRHTATSFVAEPLQLILLPSWLSLKTIGGSC